MHSHQDRQAFLPAMGAHGMLPLYDVVARLAGAGRVYRAVVEAAELRPGLRVLDVGCGTGNLVLAVARDVPDVEVVGLDPDERALARARRKVARAARAVRLDQGYAQQLPYPDASFDRVLSSLMLHHLGPGAKEGMLAEVRRVLAPGGVFLLADITGPLRGHGLLAHRRHGPRPDVVGNIPELLAAAGLRDVAEIGRPRTRLGPVTLVRAQAG